MRLPGFTAELVFVGSRRCSYAGGSNLEAAKSRVAPANVPILHGGGVVTRRYPPPGACLPGESYSCGYAQERCAYYGPTDPSDCCDYFNENCIPPIPSFPGPGGGGVVGGPRQGGTRRI
jgi:hypothetical protein